MSLAPPTIRPTWWQRLDFGRAWMSPSGNLRLGMDGGQALGRGHQPVGSTVTPKCLTLVRGRLAPDAEPLRIHQSKRHQEKGVEPMHPLLLLTAMSVTSGL